MAWLEKNYLIIVLIGLFLVFALIGYLIDSARKVNNKKEDEDIPIKVREIEINNLEKEEEEPKSDSLDELLKNYDSE